MKTPNSSQAIKRRFDSDDEDDKLIKRASYVDRAAVEDRVKVKDSDRYSIFGQYIACELREISDPELESWAKQQIVAILCQAQSGSLPAN